MTRALCMTVLLAIGSVAGVGTALSAEQEFRIGPRVGPGNIRLDAGQPVGDNITDQVINEDSVGVGGTFEYKAPFNVVVEAGGFSAGSSDWFDDEELLFTEYFVSVGYQIDLGKGFSLIPRVGRARWKFESDDDKWFFFDRDRDREDVATSRGYQNYWEVTALKRINQRFVLGVSHKENNYDFGRVRSTVFTAMFNIG